MIQCLDDGAFERNRMLASLPIHGMRALHEHLELVPLLRDQVLQARGGLIESVYFPESGVCSVVAVGDIERRIEINMVGSEGMIGQAVLLGAIRSDEEASVLVAGAALKLSTEVLSRVTSRYRDVHDALLRYAQASSIQVAQTAMSHGLDVIEKRVARWLLMCRDRVGHDLLPLTHKQLGVALGIRRSGVTHAMHILEGEHLLSAKRGMITIRDREGLRALAGSSYGGAEAAYDLLLAGDVSSHREWASPIPDLAVAS